MRIRNTIKPLLAGALLTFGGISAVFAGTLPLSLTETASGTVNSGIASTLGVPGSYTYDHTFYAPTTTISGSSYGFYDDFIFTIVGATAGSITSTIDLGNVLQINNLQARLYQPASGETLPVLGKPSNGVIDAWSIALGNGVGTVDVIAPTLLSAGTYVLELRGNVTGAAGGSYSGVLNLAPVPLPAAAFLFASAFGGLASLRRRRAA